MRTYYSGTTEAAMRSIWTSIKKETGQSVILVALMIVVLCGVAALVVDTGTAYVKEGQLQTAADAAALAAAHDLPNATTAKSTAVTYAMKNGIEAGHTTATTPYKSDAKKVEVVVTATVNYTFARILGFSSKDVSARAVAEKTGTNGGAFGYAIFSGNKTSRLGLFSSSLIVNGSIHGNQEVMMNGSSMTVNGNVEGAGAFSTNGSTITITGLAQGSSAVAHGSNINIGSLKSVAASVIDMPDLSATALAEAQANGTYYSGNKLYNGSNIDVDKSVYVSGTVTVAGSTFKGVGILVATGNIQLNGSCIEQTAAASVCIYSKSGNIQINGSNIRIDGVLYAPNGQIQVNGSNIVINGRVIASEVQLNGSSITVNSSSGDTDFLPGEIIRLVE